MTKIVALKATIKAFTSLVSQDDIIELEVKFGRITVSARKEFETSLEIVSTSTHPSLTTMENGSKQALARYGMKYATNKILTK